MDSFLTAMEDVVQDLYGHVHRVSSLAVELGRVLDITNDDLERLAAVGIFHDVGKIHVDPEILAKPGPLDPAELSHMRRHPELGFAMTVDHLDRRTAEAILHHHERWDGEGYPNGLAGTDIPFLARVVLVADAFDAITSHRAYQPAMPADYAISEIVTNAGTQFDPGVVEAFEVLVDQGLPTLIHTEAVSGAAAR